MNQIKTQLKSKKLMFAILLFITSVTFVALGKADFTDWADFIKWVFGIYAAGNVGEHASKKIK